MADPHREAWERFGRPDVQQLLQEMASLVLTVTLGAIRKAGESAERAGMNPFELLYLIGTTGVMARRIGCAAGPGGERYTIATIPVSQAGELARRRRLPHLAAALAEGMPHTAWRGGALRIVVVLPSGEVFAAMPFDAEAVPNG